MSRNPLARTLDDLDPPAWAEPKEHSHLVMTCHRLRSKRISDFTVEDLRIMIGQGIGVAHLVPPALGVIENDPLAAGDMYPGDLLVCVLSLEPGFWRQHPTHLQRLEAILERTAFPS